MRRDLDGEGTNELIRYNEVMPRLLLDQDNPAARILVLYHWVTLWTGKAPTGIHRFSWARE